MIMTLSTNTNSKVLKIMAVIGGLLLSATAARAQEIPVVNDEVLGFTGRFSASVDWKA